MEFPCQLFALFIFKPLIVKNVMNRLAKIKLQANRDDIFDLRSVNVYMYEYDEMKERIFISSNSL